MVSDLGREGLRSYRLILELGDRIVAKHRVAPTLLFNNQSSMPHQALRVGTSLKSGSSEPGLTMDSSVRQLNVAYDEQVVRVPTQKPRSIKHYCRGSLSYRPPSLGAESLFTKAMRKVLSNSSRLSTFVLKHYSEHQLQMIYDAAFKQYVWGR